MYFNMLSRYPYLVVTYDSILSDDCHNVQKKNIEQNFFFFHFIYKLLRGRFFLSKKNLSIFRHDYTFVSIKVLTILVCLQTCKNLPHSFGKRPQYKIF